MAEIVKTKKLDRDEALLLSALKMALLTEGKGRGEFPKINETVIRLAEKHSVTPLLYDCIKGKETDGNDRIAEQVTKEMDRLVNWSYRLFFETYRLVTELEQRGIVVTVLKGVAAASFYPVMEYRKSGDIDILINDPAQTEQAVEMMKELGYVVSERQDALHQIVMKNSSAVVVELHVMISEPFDNAKINDILSALLEDILKHRLYKEILGFPIPILDDDYQAFELLIHMLQHFLRRGFGIKLLCDWVYYWNAFAADKEKNEADASRYMELIELCGISGFSDMISAVCYHFLGLSGEAYGLLTQNKKERQLSADIAEEFLLDILQGGEFGDDDKGRMVVLRSTSLRSYFIEFHHQMKLNHPKAGKYPVLWPALWCITLAVFLRNNKNIRNISSREIFQKAEKRSRLMKQMKLWQFK